MTKRRGILFIISAPSGAGKTSLVKALTDQDESILASISYTTREKRAGEQDGVHYNFISKAHFEKMLGEGGFLEHANVFGNYYGTSCHTVETLLSEGKDVILEIDWQGAVQVRKLMPDCVSIFVLPPSKKALRERLESRGQDAKTTIDRRMAQAVSEMSHYAEYDYLIINDQFEKALEQLKSIFLSMHLGISSQQRVLTDLLKDLLAIDESTTN